MSDSPFDQMFEDGSQHLAYHFGQAGHNDFCGQTKFVYRNRESRSGNNEPLEFPLKDVIAADIHSERRMNLDGEVELVQTRGFQWRRADQIDGDNEHQPPRVGGQIYENFFNQYGDIEYAEVYHVETSDRGIGNWYHVGTKRIGRVFTSKEIIKTDER